MQAWLTWPARTNYTRGRQRRSWSADFLQSLVPTLKKPSPACSTSDPETLIACSGVLIRAGAKLCRISAPQDRRCVCVCVCVCVWCVCVLTCERQTWSHHNGGLCAHTWASALSVTRLCSPLGLELMVKLRTLLTVFTFILKAKARDYGNGRYISDAACGVRPITMHWISWPIRADLCCMFLMFFNINVKCQHILLHQIH